MTDIEMSSADKDEVIQYIGRVIQTFIDHDFGVHPDQVALFTRPNLAFRSASRCASSGTNQEHETVDLDDEGAINDLSPLRLEAP